MRYMDQVRADTSEVLIEASFEDLQLVQEALRYLAVSSHAAAAHVLSRLADRVESISDAAHRDLCGSPVCSWCKSEVGSRFHEVSCG